MAIILSKGIKVSHLFESKVFYHEFEFDEWPSSHFCDTRSVKPYDGTFFHLRNKFEKVFPENSYKRIKPTEKDGYLVEHADTCKVKQIKYSINFLTSTGFYIMDEHHHSALGDEHKQVCYNKDVSIMEILQETEELEIFDAEVI